MRRQVMTFSLAALLLAGSTCAAAELPFHGFLDVAAGARVVDDDRAADDFLLQEARFQLDFLHDSDAGTLQLRADFIRDGVDDESRIEVREANVLLFPLDSVDLKVGRQVLTWGTGDLVFLNDLFPKDWQSFFIGRDDEYLKKPSDALRATWFGDRINVDLAWMPLFEADGYISGERLSFWGPGRRVGPRDAPFTPVDPEEPNATPGNGSLAGRLYANFAGWETALYGFRGHYGQPKGFDPDRNRAYFPRLEAWGASLRGTLAGGVANAEGAWYRSLDDLGGDDPNVPNSELRALVGYSHEVVSDQNLGLQAYLERALDYPDRGRIDQNRWWLTARYTALFLRQTLTASLFAFYSPAEDDTYLRPKLAYKYSDAILLTVGGNVFWGAHDNSFFGQFEDNTNVYGRVRYSF